ncbi:inactive peptidyl-prolyl cis-trans isomerase FKBP6-like [Ornithodoros turicata]|uniref:inactive peptidyl-prolyl cis-trans isomerase FKBP6-like n=1 Tax=Ornithodoros turicata TaxID=34597 RepID=UPI003139B943
MSEEATTTFIDDCALPAQLLKQAVDVEKLKDGTILELSEKLVQEDADQTNEKYFQSKELLESLRLNYLDGSSDEDDAAADTLLPFEKLAKKMTPVVSDGGVLKRVMRPGAGPVVPDESSVTFHYNAYLEMADEPFDSTRLRNRPQRTLLENVSVIGLALALKTMKKGEVAQVMVSPQYAFGRMGCPPRIPQNATILYEVELLLFVDAKDAVELEGRSFDGQVKVPFEKAYKVCETKRNTGNEFFHTGEMAKALKCYSSSIVILEKVCTANDQEERMQQALLLKLYNNASLCCLKTGRANMGISYAKEALQIDKDNAKALFCYGLGSKMLGCYDDAERYLRRALRLEPNSRAIVRELELVDAKRMKEQHAEQVMCRRMFGTSSSGPKTVGLSPGSGLNGGVKTAIQQKLLAFRNDLGKENSSKELPFTVGFTEPYCKYVRSVCAELGLGCEDVPGGGVKAVAPKV